MRALGGALGRGAPWRSPARRITAQRLSAPSAAPPAAPDGYDTPLEAYTAETEVKKSRFIATVAPASSPEAAHDFVAAHRQGDARHNCWAYRVGDHFRFFDDGEPGGTAGRPILAALEASGMDHAVVLVVRYFGGVKLGAGGLTRAYGGAASACLRGAARTRVRPQALVAVRCSFAQRGAVYAALDAAGAARLEEEYAQDGASLRITARLPAADAAALDAALADATSGRVRLEEAPHEGDAAAA